MATNGGTPLRYGYRSTDPTERPDVATLRARLARRTRSEIRDGLARPAAVLVPIVASRSGLQLLCFERTHGVLEHKGEICLPGGSVDPVDAGPVEAALREANEELGIRADDVDVLGLLDDVRTVTNYVITPVVGFLSEPPTIVPDVLEVARPMSVPLDALIEGGAQRMERRATDGTPRSIYVYDFQGDRIWGATARIIHAMLSLWLGEPGSDS
jgi:8-oxo-dGTP pyrophosphatase MutT (NUDIX family)